MGIHFQWGRWKVWRWIWCWVHSSVNVLNVRAVYLKWLKVDFMLFSFFCNGKKCVQKESSSCWCDFELASCETPAWHYCAKEHLSATTPGKTAPKVAFASHSNLEWGCGNSFSDPQTPPFPSQKPSGGVGKVLLATWVKSAEELAQSTQLFRGDNCQWLCLN